MRIVLLTGKGGVGKTSLAAAHAVRSASDGTPTLLASMDAAHNLSDLFEVPPAPEPTAVAPHLDICEIDPNRVREQDFAHMTETIAGLIAPDAESFDLPGLDALFFLLKVHDLVLSQRYERVVLDLAPTGETLGLLQLPDLLSWWMEKVFPLQRLTLRVLRPVAGRVWKIQLPDNQYMNDVEALYGRLQQIAELLRDPAVTSVRLVTQPEKMVVEETRRSYLYLNLYGYSVDHVFVNGIYPAAEVPEFFHSWVATQETQLAAIDASFAHLPITRVPRFPSEIRGLPGVRTLAATALDEHSFDALDGLAHEEYLSTDAGYQLSLPLPMTTKDAITLHQGADELAIRIGNFQRNVPLPTTLHDHHVSAARYDADRLVITFSLNNDQTHTDQTHTDSTHTDSTHTDSTHTEGASS